MLLSTVTEMSKDNSKVTVWLLIRRKQIKSWMSCLCYLLVSDGFLGKSTSHSAILTFFTYIKYITFTARLLWYSQLSLIWNSVIRNIHIPAWFFCNQFSSTIFTSLIRIFTFQLWTSLFETYYIICYGKLFINPTNIWISSKMLFI